MSEASQLESGCISEPLEIRTELNRTGSSDVEADLAETEEIEQITDEQNESESDDEPGLEEWHRAHRHGKRKRQKWHRDRCRAALDESIDLLSTAVSLCPSSESGRDDILFALADVLDERYQIEDSDDDLQQSITFLREGLALRPSGHCDRPTTLNNLACALGDRYKRFGDVADLEEQIHLHQQALALRPDGNPYRSCSLINLARALNERFSRFGGMSDLEDVIHMNKHAFALHPEGHPGRSVFLAALAYALGVRYACFGDVEDLEESVGLHQQTLALRPEGHPSRSETLNNLAAVLGARYEHLKDVADLEEKIRLLHEALALRAEGHPDRADSLEDLADALSDWYRRFGDVVDQKESIHLYEQALALRPEGHPHRSISLNNLAAVLDVDSRYEHLGDVGNLEERIHLLHQALALRPEGHPDRSDSLEGLAGALSDRYSHLGDVADLKECIHLYQQALALRPEGHPGRSQTLNNLAAALGARYEHFWDAADLEKRIHLLQQALELCPDGNPHRSCSLINLADALSDRFSSFGHISDLEEVVHMNQHALALRPEGHPGRSESLDALAGALGVRYACFRDVADLEESVGLHHQALALRPEGHPDRSHSLNNLAIALGARYKHFKDVADLEEQIRLLHQALALRPEGHPHHPCSLGCLAVAFGVRYEHSGDVADLEECIRLGRQTLALRPEGHQHRSSPLNNLATALDLRYTRFGDIKDLDDAVLYFRLHSLDNVDLHSTFHNAFRWIQVAEKHNHESVLDAFRNAIARLRQYLSIGPTSQLQYGALLRETNTQLLPVDAAAYFIEKGYVEEAVELLDEGRALLLSEVRRFHRPVLPEQQAIIGKELSIQFQNICEDLRNLSNAEVRFETLLKSCNTASKTVPDACTIDSTVAYGELLKAKRLKMEAYDNLLHQIRQQPGCEDFQMPLKFSKLQQAAVEGPVVIVNCCKRRSDVIIVFSHRAPLLIPLDNNLDQLMQEIYIGFIEQMSALKERGDAAKTISGFVAPITRLLWSKVVRQVVEALQENGIPKGSRIWWCPTSFLTSLPLHAAGKGSDWLIDRYISSYTPTLSALISARQTGTGIEEPSSSSPRILVVAQTKTSGLKNAARELEEMQTLPSFQECLDEERATPQSVVAHLPGFDWAHFICHGTIADNPFESYLHLHEGSRLTLNDIIKPHMADAKFAFVAACHSAAQSRVERVLRDEVLHLSAAMQVSGFRSVVGTMWQMEDGDGPRIVRKFYEEIFKGECAGEERHTLAATALWKAVRWLRKKRDLPIARWANYIHIGA